MTLPELHLLATTASPEKEREVLEKAFGVMVRDGPVTSSRWLLLNHSFTAMLDADAPESAVLLLFREVAPGYRRMMTALPDGSFLMYLWHLEKTNYNKCRAATEALALIAAMAKALETQG